MRHHQRRHIGATAKIGRMPKADQAPQAQQKMQRGGKEAKDQNIGRQNLRKARAIKRQRRQGRNARRHQQPHLQACGFDRALWLAHLAMLARHLFAAKQPIRADHQHQHHHHKHQHQCRLRQIGYAKDVQHRDNHRRQIGARQRPHATNYHHHEHGCQNVEIHHQISATFWQLQRPAQTGQRRAQRKNARKQPRLVYAQGAHHLAVLGGGAHQNAQPGFGDQIPKAQRHKGGDNQQGDVIFGNRLAQNKHHAAQPRGTRAQQVFGAPDHQRQILDYQDHAKCGHQLKQLGRAVDRAQNQHFHDHAQQAHSQARQQNGPPKPNSPRQHLHQGVAHIGADHVKRSMGKIDNAGYAKDQAKPRCHHEKGARIGKPCQQLCDEQPHNSPQSGRRGKRKQPPQRRGCWPLVWISRFAGAGCAPHHPKAGSWRRLYRPNPPSRLYHLAPWCGPHRRPWSIDDRSRDR